MHDVDSRSRGPGDFSQTTQRTFQALPDSASALALEWFIAKPPQGFDGAAPTFVDGVGQLNIQLPAAMASGSALPLVINVGGFASPNTSTLAVQ